MCEARGKDPRAKVANAARDVKRAAQRWKGRRGPAAIFAGLL
jgi:hypothetical protein